jgi:hypothetical protein
MSCPVVLQTNRYPPSFDNKYKLQISINEFIYSEWDHTSEILTSPSLKRQQQQWNFCDLEDKIKGTVERSAEQITWFSSQVCAPSAFDSTSGSNGSEYGS